MQEGRDSFRRPPGTLGVLRVRVDLLGRQSPPPRLPHICLRSYLRGLLKLLPTPLRAGWRRREDSNPRWLAPRWFSKPVHSAALPRLRGGSVTGGPVGANDGKSKAAVGFGAQFRSTVRSLIQQHGPAKVGRARALGPLGRCGCHRHGGGGHPRGLCQTVRQAQAGILERCSVAAASASTRPMFCMAMK